MVQLQVRPFPPKDCRHRTKSQTALSRSVASGGYSALLTKIFLPINILAILHNANIVAIEQNTGYSAFLGAFPVHTEWPLSKREYDRRHLDMRWPSGTEATIELSRYRKGEIGSLTRRSFDLTSDPPRFWEDSWRNRPEDLQDDAP